VNAPRVTLWKLSVFVALVAVNLAVGRALHTSPHEAVLYALAPTVLALQVGAYRLLRVRGPRRAFWAGFIVFGLLAAATLAWAFEVEGANDPDPASRLVSFAWSAYGDFAGEWFRGVLPFLPAPPLGLGLFIASFFSLPQFLIALTGGLIALCWRRRNSRPPSGQLSSTP
jgi:hypothetical protein